MKTKLFNPLTMTKATSADMVRMWLRLWGDLYPSDVEAKTKLAFLLGTELSDNTQV